MEIKLNIPYLHDLDSLEGIVNRVEIKDREEDDKVLKAKIKTDYQDRERAKELLEKEYKPTQSKYTEFTETIKEPPFNTKAFKKELETYEDTVLLTGIILENMKPKSTKAQNGFSNYLGSKYLFNNPISGCSAVATMSTSVLRALGIETGIIKGLHINKPDKKYTQRKSAEHNWNTIKTKEGWIEIDFTKHDYGFLSESNIPLMHIRDNTEYLGKYLKFAREVEYLEDTFEILEED